MVSPGCCLGTDVMHIDDICSRLRCSPCGSNGPGLETHPRESEREMLWLEKVKEKKPKKTEFAAEILMIDEFPSEEALSFLMSWNSLTTLKSFFCMCLYSMSVN
jgi:hypothetical protein